VARRGFFAELNYQPSRLRSVAGSRQRRRSRRPEFPRADDDRPAQPGHGRTGSRRFEVVLYAIAVVLLVLAALGVGTRITLGWAGLAIAVFTFGVLTAF
jgi:Flp pilus assembly protein TadB